MGRKRLLLVVLGALAALLSALSFSVALADQPDPQLVERANEYVLQKFKKYGFFTSANIEGRPLDQKRLLLNPSLAVKVGWPMLAWGDWSQVPGNELRDGRARFVGFGYYDETVTNPFFPPDARGKGKLSDRNWIPEPWLNAAVKKAYPRYIKSPALDGCSDPEVVQRLRWGLYWAATCNGYDPPDESSDLWQNPQKYVHVYLPPSPGVWGMGVMFHLKGGSVWYVSVPLGPPVPDFYAKVTPQEQRGKPGSGVSFNVEVGCKGDPYGELGMRVILAHKTQGGSQPVPFSLEGRQSRVSEGEGVSYLDVYPARAGGTYTFTVQLQVQSEPSELVVQVLPMLWEGMPVGLDERDILPYLDADPANNEARARIVPSQEPVKPTVQAGPGLTFQAVSQDRTIVRDPGTAKWTDWVTATFAPLAVQDVVAEGESPDYAVAVAPRPPDYHGFRCECDCPDYSRIVSWRIVSAKLTYPKRNPEFTFGTPYPPLCGDSVIGPGSQLIVDSCGNKYRGSVILDPDKTVTVEMKPTADGHRAQVEFQEEWGMDGAQIHSQLEDRDMVLEPRYYTLCAWDIEVEVVYEVIHHHLVCTKSGCYCRTSVRGPYVYRYKLAPVTGKLLVNGTGVTSLAE
ncbi:Athe_2463 domain-containing protein [Ammonifex thiophilus]|uniref:Uncharacterized protein n=1 Tax=Ammonifex thiophilus TaxID=444093 RepID=A0A3D8P3H1_9THEO|nr:hypothetical protein [Ammonifex thiophilus]RDV81180.1 hypothetical protein DXX99_09825 [Ammonifex thiophilus]